MPSRKNDGASSSSRPSAKQRSVGILGVAVAGSSDDEDYDPGTSNADAVRSSRTNAEDLDEDLPLSKR